MSDEHRRLGYATTPKPEALQASQLTDAIVYRLEVEITSTGGSFTAAAAGSALYARDPTMPPTFRRAVSAASLVDLRRAFEGDVTDWLGVEQERGEHASSLWELFEDAYAQAQQTLAAEE